MSILPTRKDSRQGTSVKRLYTNEDPGEIFSQWRQGINPMAAKTGTPNREVLATVRHSVNSQNQQSTQAKHSRAPDSKKHLHGDVSTGALAPSQKRHASANGTPNAPKRAKVTNERGEAASTVKVGHAEEEKWRARWIKVFPSLIFYFEVGSEDGPGRLMRNRVLKMGAKVEQFFSTRVTHIVVKGAGTPQKHAKPLSLSRHDPNKNPFLDSSGTTELVTKAEELGMKVWNVKKLSDMLSRIAPVEPATNNDSLSTLLEDERLHGTRERDVTAPRPDYYYFKAGNKYLLIEDATSKHRTIMVKEYSNSRDGPEWPTLFESFLRVSAGNQSTVPPNKIRERAWRLFVDRKPYDGEQPPRDLKRSMSLRTLPSTPRLPELPDASPYQDASGNSVVITSNIASTSTPNTPVLAGGLPTLGSNKDRAIIQMSKRVQVLKGNARLAASRTSVEPPATGTSTPTSIPERRRSMSHVETSTKTFLPQDQVVKMLQQTREPVHESGISAQMRIRNREKVERGLKGRDQDTAAGYCENCRLKYNDLSVHIVSRKHRRFAEDPENFRSLDVLLQSLVRPLHPKLAKAIRPHCRTDHTKDDDCWECQSFDPSSYNTGEDQDDDDDVYQSEMDSEQEDAAEYDEETEMGMDDGEIEEDD